ncbi:EamA domain, partial [Dillenia turbinata]
MGAKKWYGGSQAVLSMLLVQAIATGLQLLSRVILSEGTFIFALMTYRHIIAALCVFPFAFFLERGNAKKINRRVFFWLFLNALTGSKALEMGERFEPPAHNRECYWCMKFWRGLAKEEDVKENKNRVQMAMGFFYYGLHDTTAVYATSLLNTVPILTFVLTTITRVEKLNLHTKAGKIKLLGAMFSFAGALTTILYKGKGFHIGNQKLSDHSKVINLKADWLHGTIFLSCSCCSYATWFLVQLKLSKIYPSKYWTTMMTCVIATVQSAILGFCLNRDLKVWKLDWNLQLITILYSGVFASAATFCLVSWVVSIKGPTYPAMFNPLAVFLVAVLEAIFLGALIRVGTIIGICLIIVGLYSYLWGKNNDPKSLPPAAELSTPVVPESVGPRLSAT